MNANEKNFKKDNQKEATNISAETRIINKIAQAEQRIVNGESYMEISELKDKLDLK